MNYSSKSFDLFTRLAHEMFQAACSSSSPEIIKQRYNLLLTIRDLWNNNIECCVNPLPDQNTTISNMESKVCTFFDSDLPNANENLETDSNEENAGSSDNDDKDEEENYESESLASSTQSAIKLTTEITNNMTSSNVISMDRPPSRRKPISTFRISENHQSKITFPVFNNNKEKIISDLDMDMDNLLETNQNKRIKTQQSNI